MTTTAIIAAGEARAAQVATMPRTQLIRGVDEMMTTEEYNYKPTGSNDCRADPVRDALVEALEGLLTHYVDMANSGDAGFWDCEEEPVVIASRAALKLAKGEAK